ncbi:MAG: Threonine--tRNA ligase [Clostridia bacterium 41_269]|nr:MAG: Threonine--tRNA ligase [Clostridia bacterium 41_269]
MDKVKVFLKNGEVKEYDYGVLIKDILPEINKRYIKEALAAKFNGELVDLSKKITEDGSLEIITFNDEEGKKVYLHSAAHVMAQAVKRLFPGVKLGIGPAIENGFYYDFDFPVDFSSDDLAAVEDEMAKIIKEDYPFIRRELSRQEALKLFSDLGEKYKVELIEDLPEDAVISVYEQGEFIDLCAGPHVPSTGRIKAFKLLSVAGAYWRGSENNPMLKRIYGTAFPKKSMLEEYLQKLEEAKKRDHRKLGVQLGLFSLHEEGPGFPFFHSKGMVIINELENFWRKEHKIRGYQEIKTPIILNRSLWEQSGHWDHYKENMYFTEIDNSTYALKPMNCPGAILIYKTEQRSYRDLPIRFAELGLVHRHERSGVLHGLMRVRAFTQDDAHIFMLPSQIKDEIIGVMDLVDYFYNIFGFEYMVELSTKPPKAMGSDEIWEQATNALKEAMEGKNMDYVINEGEGAFYGPKIDFHLKDCLGRTWQCGTIQLDFMLPEKFDINYIGPDGEKHRPVMLHRVIFGSIERFVGILIEHYGGAFPLWLAPVQIVILPIADRHLDYALDIKKMLEREDFRVEVDARNEKIGYKIREAEIQKIPYMLIVGDAEKEKEIVSVRKRREGDLGLVSLTEFIEKIKFERANKTVQ